MHLPLVSVCIPTYNGEDFIEEAILSALNQNYKNYEIIISDDNSKDKTLEIVNNLKRNSKVPFHIYHHRQGSIGENWNNCITHSNGEYIKFLFQDDLLEEECIDEMIKPFLNYKNVGLVFCRRKIIYDEENKAHLEWINEYKDLQKKSKNFNALQKGKLILKNEEFFNSPRNKIGEPTTVLLSKKVFNKAGYFNTSLKQALDYEFWYRVCKYFDIYFIDKELVSFRLHENQASVLNQKTELNENKKYLNLIYMNCFHYLHPKNKYYLFFRYNRFGSFLRNYLRKCLR